MSIPSELVSGKVEGRFLQAVADGSDVDTLPDEVPMEGVVVFTPLVSVYRNPNPNVAAVQPLKVICSIDSEGYLRDPEDALGVWLPVGPYKVKYELTSGRIRTHRIEVLSTHSDETPLNLRGSIPPMGPVATPGQYAELAARIDALAALSPIDSVNGQVGDVVLDANDVGAYSKLEIDLQYDVLEGADAEETTARVAADSALSSRVSTLESAPVVPDLTSSLSAEATTRANADSALSSRISTLESAPAVPDLTDELATETAARISADNALDSRIDVLEAAPSGAPDLTDELAAETSARIAADNALDARLDAVEAAPPGAPDLTDELAAETASRISADNALDARLDAVEARPVPDVTASDLEAHRTDTTDVHGIANTANLVLTDDPRLSNPRTPTVHGNSHKPGGTDVITPGDIGAATQTSLDAEAAARLAADNALDSRVDSLELAPPPHTHPASQISDSSTSGRTVMTGTATEGRNALGAAASSHSHNVTDVSGLQTQLDARLKVSENVFTKSVSISAVDYAALTTKDSATLYLITS